MASPALTRTAAILLAIALVVAATIALTPPFDRTKLESQVTAHLQKRPPASGSEETLRRTIANLQQGQPDYAHMSDRLGDAVRQQLPRSTQEFKELGPLQSVAYLGGQKSIDLYRVTFHNGWRFWAIGLGKGGLIDTLAFFKPGIPTPLEYGEGYAAFDWRERGIRFAEQFGVLLGVALFGHFVLRLRL